MLTTMKSWWFFCVAHCRLLIHFKTLIMKKILIILLALFFFTMCKKEEDKTPSLTTNNGSNQPPIVEVDSLTYDGSTCVFSQYTTFFESEFGHTFHDIVFMQNREDYKLEKNIDGEIIFVNGLLIDLTFIIDGENQMLLDSVYRVDESAELLFLNPLGEYEAVSGTIDYSMSSNKITFDVTLENNKILKGVLSLPNKKLSETEYQELTEGILSDSGLTIDDIEQDSEAFIN